MSVPAPVYRLEEISPRAFQHPADRAATAALQQIPYLDAVLAHEAAHVLADHVLYQTALVILLRLGTGARLPLLAGLPLVALRTALLEWSRAAELSCDRASALVTRDPMTVCRALMTIAAG